MDKYLSYITRILEPQTKQIIELFVEDKSNKEKKEKYENYEKDILKILE